MKVLVLCGDAWHPARVPRAGLDGLEASGFILDWIENARYWSPVRMQDYPLVILTKSNNASFGDPTPWMTPPVEAFFAEYVRQGGGLLAVHSGTAEYADTPVLRGLLGGVFAHHPDQCPVTVDLQPGHLLTSGAETFTIRDEHYFMELDDPRADVFMWTISKYGHQPGGWCRTEGAGRVAVLTPGHNVEVWLHPGFSKVLLNCMRWCGRLD